MDDFFTNYESDMTTIDDHLGSGGGATIEEMTQAEYEALPDTKLTDGILRGLKDVKSFLDADILYLGTCYSTSERMLGCWVDGKPVYQKTIVLNSSVINDEVHTDVTSLNIDRCVGIFGVYSRKASGGYNFTYAFNTYESNAYCSWARYYDSQKEITHKIYLGSGEATDYQAITIRYTKTTDAAGSGTWTPSGVNAVHYDTNEQVIGTWHDGKPLYEKTIIFDTGNVASNIDFNISAYMPVNSVVRDSSFTLDFSFNGDTYHGANWGGAYVEINGVPYLSFNIGSAVYNKHVELTIKYTKTTD